MGHSAPRLVGIFTALALIIVGTAVVTAEPVDKDLDIAEAARLASVAEVKPPQPPRSATRPQPKPDPKPNPCQPRPPKEPGPKPNPCLKPAPPPPNG